MKDLISLAESFGITAKNTPELLSLFMLVVIADRLSLLSSLVETVRKRQRKLIELLVREDITFPLGGDDTVDLFENGSYPSFWERVKGVFIS